MRFFFLGLILLFTSQAAAQGWTPTWTRKVGFAGLADPFCAHPQNPATLFSSPGSSLMVVSRDRGRTWTTHTVVTGGNQIKSILISAVDTTLMLVAQEGDAGDRILRSTNFGATWTTTLTGNFYYFGHPLTYEPSHGTNTVYTMASNVIRRSTDFGLTWDSVGSSGSFGSANGSWEDAFIRPDSANILFVADNATGIWKSADGGSTWVRVHVATGEVPALAVNPQNPAIAYASRWGGGGGFLKSTNYGTSWEQVPGFAGLNTWGVAVAPDVPEMVAFGTWGPVSSNGGGIHISRDAGATWQQTFQGLTSLNNHAVFFLDSSALFALWGDGIWKLRRPGTVSGTVFADLNGNGVRDSTDTGLQGWTVRLTGTRTDSTVSGADGTYGFSLLAQGSYGAQVVRPAGWSSTLPPGGGYDSLAVSDGEAYTALDFGAGASVIVTAPVRAAWNMLSLPVRPVDAARRSVFPSSVSAAFRYGLSGYTPEDPLRTGTGYWLKFGPAQTVAVGGDALTADTIALVPGWNLVGALGTPVPAAAVGQDPPGLLISPFYGFEGGTYIVSDTLSPLRSYWVKSGSSGRILLVSP